MIRPNERIRNHRVDVFRPVHWRWTILRLPGIELPAVAGTVGREPAPRSTIRGRECRDTGVDSPVLISDVVVGSVGKMTVDNWHADVEIAVKPDVTVPANAVATVGQTSLLGSMHLALNPPLGENQAAACNPVPTIPLTTRRLIRPPNGHCRRCRPS